MGRELNLTTLPRLRTFLSQIFCLIVAVHDEINKSHDYLVLNDITEQHLLFTLS